MAKIGYYELPDKLYFAAKNVLNVEVITRSKKHTSFDDYGHDENYIPETYEVKEFFNKLNGNRLTVVPFNEISKANEWLLAGVKLVSCNYSLMPANINFLFDVQEYNERKERVNEKCECEYDYEKEYSSSIEDGEELPF